MTDHIPVYLWNCPHEFCADVTGPMKKWLTNFGVEDSVDRAYYFQVLSDGTAQLCDSTDGSAGIVFDLPDLRYCPLCGRKYPADGEPDPDMGRYMAFLIDGAFVDADDAYTSVLHFAGVDIETAI